jgi:hypothetical protein
VNHQLDVLLLEDRIGAGEVERTVLEAAGHRVHRCHDRNDDDGFACRGITGEGRCPLDGPIDVALLIRRRDTRGRPALADATRCVLRHDVPIVDEGAEADDPRTPWINQQVEPGESLVSACLHAADRAQEPLRRSIIERIRPALDAANISPDTVTTDIYREGDALIVRLGAPTDNDPRLVQALSVRVLDAVRATRTTHGRVDVHVQAEQRRWTRRTS